MQDEFGGISPLGKDMHSSHFSPFDPLKDTDEGGASTSATARLVERVSVDLGFVNRMLYELNLVSHGDFSIPEEGRIASNIRIKTTDGREVVLRFYPAGCQDTKLESGNVQFEVEVLTFLAAAKVLVPAPLHFRSTNLPIWDEEGIKVFAYFLIPGKCLKITDLSVQLAERCGLLLKDFTKVSETFSPRDIDKAPKGDLKYILRISKIFVENHQELRGDPLLEEMVRQASNPALHEFLATTPKGIVHADFFFENILIHEDRLGIIDFGDAYYGHVIMDIVIGSMEFSVKENKEWDLSFFRAFISPHVEWLKKYSVSFDLFHELLLANCLRFAIYTLPNTIEQRELISDNPYINRFVRLREPFLKNQLERVYNALII